MLNTKTLVILGLAVAAQHFWGGGFSGLQQMQAQGEINRANRAKSDQAAAQLQISQDGAKARDATAKSRYQSGCLMVVSGDNPRRFTAITEGAPVVDDARNVPLSVGNIVCDANGLTGEIIANPQDPRTPVVGLTAFTADRSVVAAAMNRYRGARYSMPKQ
jgi:hypothetical protein